MHGQIPSDDKRCGHQARSGSNTIVHLAQRLTVFPNSKTDARQPAGRSWRLETVSCETFDSDRDSRLGYSNSQDASPCIPFSRNDLRFEFVA